MIKTKWTTAAIFDEVVDLLGDFVARCRMPDVQLMGRDVAALVSAAVALQKEQREAMKQPAASLPDAALMDLMASELRKSPDAWPKLKAAIEASLSAGRS